MYENLPTIAELSSAPLPAALLASLEGTAPLNAVLALAAALLAMAGATVTALAARRRGRRLEMTLRLALERLTGTEQLLASTAADLAQARSRLDQVVVRQEAASSAGMRTGFRQAIALSRHGATTRQLIDTCGLSQGEAHLIQTLYGRLPAGQAEELH